MVPGLGINSEWVKAAFNRVLVPEPRAGSRQVEDLDHLRADGALEHSLAANDVLAGHAPLLVRSGAQGPVGVAA